MSKRSNIVLQIIIMILFTLSMINTLNYYNNYIIKVIYFIVPRKTHSINKTWQWKILDCKKPECSYVLSLLFN